MHWRILVNLRPRVNTPAYGLTPGSRAIASLASLKDKGLVTPGNGGQTYKICAEFGYPVIKFISSATRGSSDRYAGHRSQAMTA